MAVTETQRSVLPDSVTASNAVSPSVQLIVLSAGQTQRAGISELGYDQELDFTSSL